jgi:hypothetical protein
MVATTTAMANARQTVAAPVRQPRRFGIFSVVDVVDGGESHWLMGGLTSDGEECSRPEGTSIICGPTSPKDMRSWYSDIEADPWLAYMFETCKTVGRWADSAARLRARFLASEQSAVETEFQDNVLDLATATELGSFFSVRQAVAQLEADAASTYGGQIILHLGFAAAGEIADSLIRVGDHLETVGGNLVSVGNYHADHSGGSVNQPIVYATGAVVLYRTELIESGPVINTANNDYFTLIERGYAALVDCYQAKATGVICNCEVQP